VKPSYRHYRYTCTEVQGKLCSENKDGWQYKGALLGRGVRVLDVGLFPWWFASSGFALKVFRSLRVCSCSLSWWLECEGLMWGWGARYLGVGLLPSWFGTSVFFVDVFRSSHLSSFPLLRRPGGEGGALLLLFWGIFSLFPVVGGFVSCFYEISRFYLVFFFVVFWFVSPLVPALVFYGWLYRLFFGLLYFPFVYLWWFCWLFCWCIFFLTCL